MAGPFDAYFEEVKKRDAASTAARVRLNPLDPGQAAENLAAAKELGAPAGQVMAFPELYKDKLAQKKATTALADAPQLSDWLRSDPVNAALAKDDLENASWWERTFRGGWNAANRGTQSVGQSLRQFQATQSQQRATDLKQDFLGILDSERESVVVDGVERKQFISPGDVVGAAYRFGMSRLSSVMGNDDAAKAVEFQQQAGKIRERISAIPMTPGGERFRDRMGSIDTKASITDQVRQFAEKVAEDPGDFASFMLQVGAESIPSMAVAGATTAVTRSPAAGAAALGIGSGAREYGSTVTDELASTGYDLTTPEGALAALNDTGLLDRAKQKGNARALVIGIMDGMSGGVAGKALMQSPLGNVIAQGLAQAVMAGAGEAAGQFASEGRITSIPDILIEAMADMVTAPAEIGSVAGRGLFRPQQQIAQAGGTAAILDTASQQAQASQLRERSPERFKEMLDKSGGGEQLVYVPAQGLRELFQSKDVPFEDMADVWGIDPATMAEMELTGGRVAVPMSNFAAYIAGTDAEAWVRENATMGPDELSLSEAQSQADLVPDDMAEAYERQLQEMREEDAKRSSDQQVFDGFYSQLREAGRTADVADKEARVMSAFFRTMAGRIGEDSLELAQRFGVKVQGPDKQGLENRSIARHAFSDEGSNQPISFETIVNGLPSDPEQVSNILEGISLIAQTDGFGSIPSLAPVFSLMRRVIRENPEVLDAIVGTIPIDVVNNLAGSQETAKMLLHDQAVLKDSPAFDANLPVPEGVDAAATARLLVGEIARMAAKRVPGISDSGGETAELNAAVGTDQGQTFRQGELSDKRGSIVLPLNFGYTSTHTIINLFEKADLSSMMHEAGHFFLETLNALAADPDAPQAIRDDMAAVRKYLGVEDGQSFTEDQHETFARSFEAYLMEGKAPSLELADVFARVKEWLVRIYRDIRGLNVKLSPQIREVFDRMLASEAEIAAAREDLAASPLFREKPAGMSDADWSTYQRMARRSKDQADARLRERMLEKVRREKEAWWKAERKQLRAEVEAHTNALPQYRLIEAMANGRVLVGPDEVVDAADVRISRKDLVEQFGAGVLAELSRERFGGKRAIYADDGIHPALAAEMFGFAGPVEMVQILQNTRKRVEAIDVETDRIMAERYGDPFTDGTIEQEAVDAIHSEQQAQKNVAEARQMAKQMGRDTRGMTASLYRQRARLMLGRMTVREASASNRFLAAERRAGRDAERAFSKVARGNANALAEALQAKEQQILNAALYDLSREAEREVSRAREKMQAYGKKSVRQKLEGGYIEQIDDLLDRYDFRKQSPGQVAKTERLRDFVDRMVAEGREAELMIDPRMMDEARRVHYSRVSLDEFRGLVDTIANLDHLGRFKQTLINARRKRDFIASRDRITDMVRERGRDEMSGPRSKAAQSLREVLNTSKTSHTIVAELDGLQETGPVFDELLADVYEGEKREAQMRLEMEGQMNALIRKFYTRKELAAMKTQRHVPGANARLWSKAEIISVALNTGNEENFQRLTDESVAQSERLNKAQVEALVATLDEKDWQFVQGYWDQIDSYAPELGEVHQRRTGVAMKKVQARQMVAAPASVRGGYYPIKYNPLKSARAATDEASMWDRMTATGRGGGAKVDQGRTTERKSSGGGRALRFDLGVGIEGMRDTIRIITLSEAVDNSARLLRDGEVKQTFLDRQLGHEWTMLDLTLQDVASGPIYHNFWGEKAARVLKNNISAMFLGLNPKSALLQVTGAAQSAAVIGTRNLARGYVKYIQDRGQLLARIKEVSPLMAERERTMNKDFADMMADPANTNPVRSRGAQAVSKIQQFGYTPMQKIQYYTVDVPTWAGAYLSKIEAGETEAQAASYADLMVERSQGGSFMSERSAWSRGTVSANIRQSAMVRIWTTLAGYMINKLNRGIIEVERGAKGIREGMTAAEKVRAAANAATNLTLLYVAEGVLTGLMWTQLDDDDEPEDFLEFVLEETGMAMLGGLPIIRDMVGFATEGRGAGGMHETIGAIPGRIWQQASQGENDKQFRRSVADGIGAVTGLPTTSGMRFIEGLIGDDDKSWVEMLLGKNPLGR